MYIRVDSREPEQIYKLIIEKHKIDATYELLQSGDYLFSDICVERKTVGDLLASCRDGRIWEQLRTAVDNYPRVYILLEGFLPYSYNPSTALDEMKAIGGVLGVAMGWGIPIIPSSNLEQTAKIIVAMYGRSNKEKVEYLKPVKKKHFTPEEIREDIVCTIPGVGRKTARTILKKFPSIADLMLASDEDILAVRRVGPKTLEWIRTVFNHNEQLSLS